MKKIIEFAHVGLQKTGSTWLQKDLFSKHPDLTVLGSTAKNENLTKVRPVLFDFLDPNFNKENFLQQFNSLQDLFPEKSINGISDENLSGHIYTGKNSVVIADNLYDIFGDLKIILILRNPVTYIQSAYFQRRSEERL